MAFGLSKELGSKIPFHSMAAGEVYSSEVKKTEILIEAIRKAIGVRIKEVKEVFEGEITELKLEEIDDPLNVTKK